VHDATGAKGEKAEEPSAEFDELAHQVIGAALEVHRILGPGFLESVYKEGLCVELETRGIRCARQVPVGVDYKGRKVGEARLDLLVESRVVVELKAVEAVAPIHLAQVLSYLKATKLRLALLITLHVPVLRHGIRRLIILARQGVP
jgi:GxxExxY protein